MKKISRRSFIEKTSTGIGAALVLAHLPQSLLAEASASKIPIGFQTYPIRNELAKDFMGTLKMMHTQGYQVVEMCYPKGYANSGFGPLVNMKMADMRQQIADAGLKCPSCHYGFGTLNNSLEECIDFAQQLGNKQMICSSFGLPKTASLNDYLVAADKLNSAAEKIKKSGMQAGFHNHSIEFVTLDGQFLYDALLNRLDAGLVKMQFQTEVINGGYKASTYFRKYPGRFISAHLSDWNADKKQVPLGQGLINWKEFFAASKKGGVQHFFVEMDADKFKDSAVYLRTLRR